MQPKMRTKTIFVATILKILSYKFQAMKTNSFILLALILTMLSLSQVHVSAAPVQVHLIVGIIDPTDNQDEPQRSPAIVPDVEIEDYVLTFITPCDSMELRIVNEDNGVEFTTIISGSTLILPSYLNGNYQLQIISENYVFYGDITL